MEPQFLITGIRRVIFVGKEEYPEPKVEFRNHLKSNELIFHLSGQELVHFNGKILHTDKNVIRFLPKGENREYIVENLAPGDCIDVFFDTDRPVAEEAFVMKCPKAEAVGNLFKKLFSVWVGKDEGYYFACISLLYQIFAQMQKRSYIPENQYQAIRPAIEYIGAHFLDRKLSAEDLADRCGISPSYLKKLFLKKYGLPPTRYIIGLKLNYACDLLQSGLYSVSRIAELCGYSDISFFSRQFKEYMGISPTAFIEKYKSSK